MVQVPDPVHTTKSKVFDWYSAQSDDFRDHMGASLIGHHCDRYIWLTFHWAVKPHFIGRIRRLFGTGKREEPRVYEELRAIGVDLHTEDEGKQIECRDDSGHFGGSVDGIGLGFPEGPKAWAVLEVKTMGDKAYGELNKSGVKAAKPQHYAQMQTYMGQLNLDRALYFAVNKNTDEIHTEWVHFDPVAYAKIVERKDRLISAKTPPIKVSEDPAHWLCKMCDMYKFCHHGDAPETNCRTCVSAMPVADGQWRCTHHGRGITSDEQRAGCKSHTPLLVAPVEAATAPSPPRPMARSRYVKPAASKAPKEQYMGPVPFDDDIPF